ncbi:H(+)-transporting V1 sector ATPase subunit H [Microbotryomycetes sp. JL221]|nr:H(+)-transporting V1 sector ATPase subunit H [Microbotryomycetes sp. JL221]
MALVHNSQLSDRSTKIRSKAIPWEGYQRAGLLSADEVQSIQKITSQRSQAAEQTLESQAKTYANLYIRLLAKLSRNDTLQYILVLVGDFVQGETSRVASRQTGLLTTFKWFVPTDREDRVALLLAEPDCYSPLLKLVDSQDDFVKQKSSVVASTLLSLDSNPPNNVVQKLLSHLTLLIRNTQDPEGQDVGVQCLESALRVDKVRKAAWQAESASNDGNGSQSTTGPKVIEGLVQLLRTNPNAQMQYQLGFCFWLLTFDEEIAGNVNQKYNIIPLLTDMAKQALKEKVIRIVLSTLRNLITKSPESNLPAMLINKLLPFVKTLQTRKWSDDEVKEDVDFLVQELTKSFEGLTTFDEYRTELEQGHLSWTPPHKNDEFWRDNAQKLNDKDRALLKTLVQILITSKDSLTLAVAANDVAQYVKYCDTSKKTLDDLGAKARVMELMGHSDPDVKYNSLVATQRLMSHAWGV